MKIKKVVILLFNIILIFSCIENKKTKTSLLKEVTKNTKTSLQKEETKILDLNNFNVSQYDINKLFTHKLNDSVGYIDTIFSNNGILILKTNIKKIDKGEDIGIYTIRRITILNNKQIIYENDSIIDFGEIEYNSKLGLLTVPLIYDEDGESFSTTCNLLLCDIKKNKTVEIDKNLSNLTNAPITDDSLIYYIANSSIFSYNNSHIHEVVQFENPSNRAFKFSYIKNKYFDIIYFRKFPEDSIPLQVIIPLDSIFKK